MVPDVRERQEPAEESAAPHDATEARESEQERPHSEVNVTFNPYARFRRVTRRGRSRELLRSLIVGRWSTLITGPPFLRLQILLPRWETVVTVSNGGDRRENYRCVPVIAGPSRLSSPISRNHQGKETQQLRPSSGNIYGDCFRR